MPYDLPEIMRDLKQLADYDWDAFFARHVTATQENLPLDVVGRCGYRLGYTTKSPAYLDYLQGRAGGDLLSARDSLGLTFHGDGRIADVAPALPGDKAGLAPGMHVLGVNSKKFSRERLDDALADSVARRKIEFLLLDGEQFRTVTVDYADGLRYLELVRQPERPDVLGAIRNRWRRTLPSDAANGLQITIRAAMKSRGNQVYFSTFTWKPAALRALTSATASKLPVTVNVLVLAFAVSPVTPSTFLIVFLMALLQEPQQL